MLMTKPRSNPSTPVRDSSPHAMTMTASPGSSTWLATSIFGTPGNTIIGVGGASWLTRRASLPSCQSANAIASWDPMASPSGRTCDDSTKRCRLRISSAMRARTLTSVAVVIVAGFGGALRVLFVNVAQDLLNPILVRDRFVEPEFELGDPAQLQPGADLAAEEAGGPGECARGLLARVGIAQACVVHASQLQVRRDLHARERDEPDARIVHLAAAEDFAQLLANLVADAIWSIALSQLRRGRRLHPFHREHFDDIVHFDVVEAFEADAALEAGFDLAHIVLEAAQRGNLPFEDDDVVAQQPGCR